MADPLGINYPLDFPKDAYARVNDQVAKHITTERGIYLEYAGGWNGVGYRFRALAEASDSFAASINRAGNSPKAEERYGQERDLFAFFINSLAALESLGYAAHAMASIAMESMVKASTVSVNGFPLTTPAEKRGVTLRTTRDRFFSQFPAESLTASFAALIATAEFAELETIRNVLAHRAAPPRNFFRGGDRDGEADWSAFGISLDQDATKTRRQWVAEVLTLLLEASEVFAAGHL